MHIALCDDEENALLLLREMVQAFCEKKRLEAVIDLFSGGEDFLASAQRYDILFMDIYLPGMNGMEAAERAGALALQQIVFTTVSREYAVEAFRLNAAHYLTKPLSAQSVAEAMEQNTPMGVKYMTTETILTEISLTASATLTKGSAFLPRDRQAVPTMMAKTST